MMTEGHIFYDEIDNHFYYDENEDPMKSMEERVAGLPRIEMSEVVGIHLYDDADAEWQSHFDNINKYPITLSKTWSGDQIKEYVLISVLGVSDRDLFKDENDRVTDGFKIVDSHRHDGIQTIQFKDEKNTSLLIVEWW